MRQRRSTVFVFRFLTIPARPSGLNKIGGVLNLNGNSAWVGGQIINQTCWLRLTSKILHQFIFYCLYYINIIQIQYRNGAFGVFGGLRFSGVFGHSGFSGASGVFGPAGPCGVSLGGFGATQGGKRSKVPCQPLTHNLCRILLCPSARSGANFRSPCLFGLIIT